MKRVFQLVWITRGDTPTGVTTEMWAEGGPAMKRARAVVERPGVALVQVHDLRLRTTGDDEAYDGVETVVWPAAVRTREEGGREAAVEVEAISQATASVQCRRCGGSGSVYDGVEYVWCSECCNLLAACATRPTHVRAKDDAFGLISGRVYEVVGNDVDAADDGLPWQIKPDEGRPQWVGPGTVEPCDAPHPSEQ